MSCRVLAYLLQRLGYARTVIEYGLWSRGAGFPLKSHGQESQDDMRKRAAMRDWPPAAPKARDEVSVSAAGRAIQEIVHAVI